MRGPVLASALVLLPLGVTPGGLAAQVRTDSVGTHADSVRILAEAREAQARFERIHRRHFPLSLGGGWGCDEEVGRFCLRHTVGYRWRPPPETEGVVEARAALLSELAAAGRALPGDGWILGQRVRYLADAGLWGEALALTGASCRVSPRDLCARLRGAVLHLLGRYTEAGAAFQSAFPADSLRDPGPLPDREARDAIQAADPERRGRVLDRFWWLSDPLRLVPGNDRLTAHAARRTEVHLRRDARTPWSVRWGEDLTELVVRYGVETGWQRAPPRPLRGRDVGVTGHHDPDGRRWVPSGRLLLDPWSAEPPAFDPESERTRSVYAPSYARDFRPGTGWTAVLREGDTLTVVGVLEHGPLPTDTPRVGGDPAGRPLRLPPDSVFPWAGELERTGLFLLSEDGAEAEARSIEGGPSAVLVRVPAGRHLVSLERWDPAAGRASRIRRGIDERPRPPDLPTLSDLLLLEPEREEPGANGPRPDEPRPGEPDTDAPEANDPEADDPEADDPGADDPGADDPGSPAELLPRLRADIRLQPGEELGLAWQVWGLGWGGEEPITYRLALEPAEEGFLRRAGAWLGLVDDAHVLALEWSERGPRRPTRVLRSVNLTVPSAEPGRYRLVLRVSLPGRSPLVSTRPVEVVERPASR